jgi:hypothetical protein
MKLYKDCRWIRPRAVFPVCGRPSAAGRSERSPVDGQVRELRPHCETHRDKWGKCGPDAKFWEPKASAVGFV